MWCLLLFLLDMKNCFESHRKQLRVCCASQGEGVEVGTACQVAPSPCLV